MIIIEPHIHMYSRTTDDYQEMYNAGIRACVEPSFWLGTNRRYAGTFFDYYRLILEFETVRAKRFGIDHFVAISVNPKEAEDLQLADEVLAGIDEYLQHERCIAIGEIGFNNITANEEKVFIKQLRMAKEYKLPVIVHLPHIDKLRGTELTIEILKAEDMDCEQVIIDHNTEETVALSKATNCYVGFTVYPISKLTPERVSNIIHEFGAKKMIINGSADWGISEPLSLLKVVKYMQKHGHSEETIQKLVFANANSFYSFSPKWKPNFNIEPMDPRQFQR